MNYDETDAGIEQYLLWEQARQQAQQAQQPPPLTPAGKRATHGEMNTLRNQFMQSQLGGAAPPSPTHAEALAEALRGRYTGLPGMARSLVAQGKDWQNHPPAPEGKGPGLLRQIAGNYLGIPTDHSAARMLRDTGYTDIPWAFGSASTRLK
jgi:hypothetical protein